VGTLGKKKTNSTTKGVTRVVERNLNPVWDEEFELRVLPGDLESEVLSVEVWDKDRIGSDDLIGEATLPLAAVLWQPLSPADRKNSYAWHKICDKAGKACGDLRLGLSFQPPASHDSSGDTTLKTDVVSESPHVQEVTGAAAMSAAAPAARLSAPAARLSEPELPCEMADAPRDSFSRALTVALSAAEAAVDEGKGDDAAVRKGGRGRRRVEDLLYSGAPVVRAGQDERLPRVISALAGIKIVAIAAGGAHSLFLTSKLARRQRLVARCVLCVLCSSRTVHCIHANEL
jgi:hypothetical protein